MKRTEHFYVAQYKGEEVHRVIHCVQEWERGAMLPREIKREPIGPAYQTHEEAQMVALMRGKGAVQYIKHAVDFLLCNENVEMAEEPRHYLVY